MSSSAVRSMSCETAASWFMSEWKCMNDLKTWNFVQMTFSPSFYLNTRYPQLRQESSQILLKTTACRMLLAADISRVNLNEEMRLGLFLCPCSSSTSVAVTAAAPKSFFPGLLMLSWADPFFQTTLCVIQSKSTTPWIWTWWRRVMGRGDGFFSQGVTRQFLMTWNNNLDPT